MDIWRGSGGKLEEAAKEIRRTPTGTETCVTADGKVLNWLEAKRLEDGKTVEIGVSKKERNSWNSGSSLEEWTTMGGEKTVEEWETCVQAEMKNSMQ